MRTFDAITRSHRSHLSPLATKTSLKAYFPHLSLKFETILSEEEDSESEQELIGLT